jgi:hypothetical protein
MVGSRLPWFALLAALLSCSGNPPVGRDNAPVDAGPPALDAFNDAQVTIDARPPPDAAPVDLGVIPVDPGCTAAFGSSPDLLTKSFENWGLVADAAQGSGLPTPNLCTFGMGLVCRLDEAAGSGAFTLYQALATQPTPPGRWIMTYDFRAAPEGFGDVVLSQLAFADRQAASVRLRANQTSVQIEFGLDSPMPTQATIVDATKSHRIRVTVEVPPVGSTARATAAIDGKPLGSLDVGASTQTAFVVQVGPYANTNTPFKRIDVTYPRVFIQSCQ